MKFYLPLLLILLLGIYLNQTYAAFYRKIGQLKLQSPNSKLIYDFNKNSNQKTFKYIALGDSLTAGVGSANYQQTYPYIIAQKLNSRPQLKDQTIQLVNLGIPGAKSSDLNIRILERSVSENPALITILIGINDMHDWVPLPIFEKNLNFLIDNLQSKTNAKIILINIPYLGTGPIENTPIQTMFDWHTKMYNQVILKIAQQKNLQCIDLYNLSKLKSESDKTFYSQDDFHPSASGYQYWGNQLNASINL